MQPEQFGKGVGQHQSGKSEKEHEDDDSPITSELCAEAENLVRAKVGTNAIWVEKRSAKR